MASERWRQRVAPSTVIADKPIVAMSSAVPLSIIVPTRDEERNLAQTLSSIVGWADQVFVFDSFSDDRTLEIARGFGVDIIQRVFDNFAAHKNWALDNLPL